MAFLSTRAAGRGAVHAVLQRLLLRITATLVALAAELPLHAPPTTLPLLVAGRLLLALCGRLMAWAASPLPVGER